MHIYARPAMILGLLLVCSACSNDLFSKQWRVVNVTDTKDKYCQSGGNHLDVGDDIKASRFLFWNKSLMADRHDPALDWKLTGISYDAWSGGIFGTVMINHEECFMVRPVRLNVTVNGKVKSKKAVQIFLKSTAGAKCDSQLIDATFITKVLNGNCSGSHSGGWLAQ